MITPLVTAVLPYTTHVSVTVSTADQKYALSSYFTHRQSTILQYETIYSGTSSSLEQKTSVTSQHYSPLHSESDSVIISVVTAASSYQTPTLESLTSLKLTSSSLSSVSSSSLSLLLTPSPSSSWVLLQTSSYGFFSLLTPSLTRHVESSSMVPSPSAVRPTNGIEIEVTPLYNVSDTFCELFYFSLSSFFAFVI